MEWTSCLKKSIEYAENHLLEDIHAEEVAKAVHISPFYFQKGFKVLTGITITEYIRNRRLYLAALELLSGEKRIIDLSYKYGYDTPESFSKAFSRFHGVSPAQIKGDVSKIKLYLPLKISISILGGNTMDCVIEKRKSFQVIGFSRHFEFDSAYENIPKFWDEFLENCKKNQYGEILQSVIEQSKIGEYGISINTQTDESGFRYMIAGMNEVKDIPTEMEAYEIPEMEWAIFRCVGPLPGALQTVNTEIYKEWLPGNNNYEIACGINIEWYSLGDCSSQNYKSEIWIPVKRK